MKNIFLVFTMVFALTLVAGAGETAVKSISGFTLPGSDDQNHSLSDFSDAKAVVILFVSTQCPVSRGFDARMVELAKTYQAKDIVFLGINSNKAESLDDIKAHATAHDYSFVVLKDKDNVVADQFKAKVTPEAFVLSTTGDVLYHGRIDDAPDPAERKAEDLKNALDQLVAGQDVALAETKAFGCSIKRVSN
jgi:peroxiredoxin